MSRKILIALSGWKQSGKSTVASMIEDALREDFKYANNVSALKVESFATPFKRIIEGTAAAHAPSLGDFAGLFAGLFRFGGCHQFCFTPLISILQPVSLAARRTFCPSLPMARES